MEGKRLVADVYGGVAIWIARNDIKPNTTGESGTSRRTKV